MLWIAFKNYYLRDEGQLQNIDGLDLESCELLSKIIIFVMKDNTSLCVLASVIVVNCFQKLLSSWWRTTGLVSVEPDTPLWIAFKNYYLRDEGQLCANFNVNPDSCELLSKIIIFVMKDNLCVLSSCLDAVVNCFQKLLSSWWRTTSQCTVPLGFLLWIAFKNYYLRDEGQQSQI